MTVQQLKELLATMPDQADVEVTIDISDYDSTWSIYQLELRGGPDRPGRRPHHFPQLSPPDGTVVIYVK